MKILVIGGSGVISTDIVERSVLFGHEVTILTRGKHQAPEGVEHLICDVNDTDGFLAAIQGRAFDVVADFISYGPEQLLPKLRCLRGKYAQYIFISSAAVYDRGYGKTGARLSAIPPFEGTFSEDRTPTSNFGWDYARGKIACEHELMKERALYGAEFTVVRPAETYNRQRIPGTFVCDGAWYTQIDRMLRGQATILHDDGLARAPFTYAEDFARAFTGLYLNPRAYAQAFHITTDELLSWRQVAETIAKLAGVEPNLRFIPSKALTLALPRSYLGDTYGVLLTSKQFDCPGYDNKKIRSAVPGFRCEISFEAGMKKVFAYYDAHPEARRIDEKFNQVMDQLAQMPLS